MAGSADDGFQKSSELVPIEPRDLVPGEATTDQLQLTAARLYGQCFTRGQVARILIDHLAPAKRPGKRDRTDEERMAAARMKLRRWERKDDFRDLVYQHAVVDLDLQIPEIYKGVAYKAKRGRIDAARLALEVTGRHNPRGDQNPPNVQVIIANIPRPE